MSNYDPFVRGPHPAGTRSFSWTDESRGRTLPVDVWYPATEAHDGQDFDDETRDVFQPFPLSPEVRQDAVRDVDARTGSFALVIFSHGFGGVRTQSTHLCTHLASHGYVVAAMDHVGNTTLDMMQMMNAPPTPETFVDFMRDRPLDASYVIDRMLAGEAGVQIDGERIGISGHSFGGWTSLATTARDRRVRAALPLAPAGGDSPLQAGDEPNILRDGLDLAWDRSVPTLFLFAEFDTLLPLEGMRDLVSRTPAPSRALVLCNSDHFHFCDRVAQTHDLFQQMGPMLVGGAAESSGRKGLVDAFAAMKSSSELCSEQDAFAMTCGLGLAHMDAHLRENEQAASLLTRDLVALMGDRGISVSTL